MRKAICISFIASLVFVLPVFAGNDGDSEEKIIEKALTDYYYQGLKNSDPELLKQIFHDDWLIMFVQNGRVMKFNKEQFVSFFDPSKAQPDLNWDFEVYSVDITGTAAAAKVRIENDKIKYTDYFNLLKIDGKWWIVHKISFGEPKQ